MFFQIGYRNKITYDFVTSENFLSKFPHIEEWGRGTIDMIEDALEHGLPEPEFEDTGTAIVVTFRKMINEGILREINLNERQIETVKYLKEEGNIKNQTYRDLFDVSKRTAAYDLTDLF